MIDYRLVPVEPTPEMVEAAEDAYMPFGDMEMAIRMALLAAPDVQGEPVAFASFADMELCMHRPAGGEWTPVYTTPQPAEHKPDRDVRMLAASLYQACGAYDMPTRVLDALSAAANGEPFAHMIDGLLPCVPPSNQDVQGDTVGAEQQPAPDVAGLVEALELARIDLKEWLKSFPNASREPTGKIIERIDTALAAHRKQKENK